MRGPKDDDGKEVMKHECICEGFVLEGSKQVTVNSF